MKFGGWLEFFGDTGWLEFEDGNDPWGRSKDALCDQWDEWEGMQSVVAEEKATEASAGRRARRASGQ